MPIFKFTSFVLFSTQGQWLALRLDPLMLRFWRPSLLSSPSRLVENASGLLVLLWCVDDSILPIVVLVLVDALRHRLTLKDSLSSRLFLLIEEPLLVLSSLFGVVSDWIAAN